MGGAASSPKKTGGTLPPRGAKEATKSALPQVPTDFAAEMATTVRACAGRMSDRDDEDDDELEDTNTLCGTPSSASTRGSFNAANHRSLRKFSGESAADETLEHAETVGGAYELTKAKLLAYCARRGGVRAISGVRRRSYDAQMAGDPTQDAKHEALMRSGSMRAARTRRASSDPPSLLVDSSFALAAIAAAESGSESTPPRVRPSKLQRASTGSVPNNCRRGISMSEQPGVPHFREAA